MIEEPELEKLLGQVYLDYKNRVPMFFLNYIPFYLSKKIHLLI